MKLKPSELSPFDRARFYIIYPLVVAIIAITTVQMVDKCSQPLPIFPPSEYQSEDDWEVQVAVPDSSEQGWHYKRFKTIDEWKKWQEQQDSIKIYKRNIEITLPRSI